MMVEECVDMLAVLATVHLSVDHSSDKTALDLKLVIYKPDM